MENGIPKSVDGDFNLPEWETSSRHKGKHIPAATQESFKDRALSHFDRVMPPHRTYFGASRRVACIVLAVALLLLLALIIGLAAGLSPHSSYAIVH